MKFEKLLLLLLLLLKIFKEGGLSAAADDYKIKMICSIVKGHASSIHEVICIAYKPLAMVCSSL